MQDTTTERRYSLDELNAETRFGGAGTEKLRAIPQIDMSDYESRQAEIADQLWDAATETGFFQLTNHSIPQALVDQAFAMSERFFALDSEVKQRYPLGKGTNAGWEYKAQVRPSTGTADQKESYQITLTRMKNLWPDGETVAGFKSTMLAFERMNWRLGMQVLDCFALKLGFKPDFFTECHDPLEADYQSTLRLLHYLGMEDAQREDLKYWRAGAHTDFDCLTLLHQRPGHGGLQLCPGKESDTLEWTDVEPLPGVVTCNIGDMLMRWSDDKLKSTLHRVRMPRENESLGPRYSMAFFCQANENAMIQGPDKTYDPITAYDYMQQRLAANFAG